ncbi:MAG TPA: LysE family transporter [Steroidobacteraceae bacterium]|jgi:threonine/homoserine/homoserine lactone efflux protein|nr:LysE family transporter [Steroidobacteraceae bacterium]
MNAVHAFLFGITLAIAIGPIALLIINNGLNHGLAVAVRSGFGAASADLLYSIIAFLVGARVVAALSGHEAAIRVASGAALVAVGVWLAIKVLRETGSAETAAQPGAGPKGFWVTFLLTVANPLTLAIFLGFAGQLSLDGDNRVAILLSLCVFLGSLVVQMILALLGASLGKWITDRRSIRVLNFVSAAAIAAFGLNGIMG